MAYDRAHWEQLWTKTLREHPDKVRLRPPNPHLVTDASLEPRARVAVSWGKLR